jgi:hypothetical protein
VSPCEVPDAPREMGPLGDPKFPAIQPPSLHAKVKQQRWGFTCILKVGMGPFSPGFRSPKGPVAPTSLLRACARLS